MYFLFSEAESAPLPPPPPPPPSIQLPQPEREVEISDPAKCTIIPGRETTIEIQKGKAGLGLSIVGGADTLLVSRDIGHTSKCACLCWILYLIVSS